MISTKRHFPFFSSHFGVDYLIVQDRVSKVIAIFFKKRWRRADFFFGRVELGIFVYSKLYRSGKYPSTTVTIFNRYEFYTNDNIVYFGATEKKIAQKSNFEEPNWRKKRRIETKIHFSCSTRGKRSLKWNDKRKNITI